MCCRLWHLKGGMRDTEHLKYLILDKIELPQMWKQFCGSKFLLVCGPRKHLLRKQIKIASREEKMFLNFSKTVYFLSKCFLVCATRKHFRKQCFRSNVSSFAGALRQRDVCGTANHVLHTSKIFGKYSISL